MSSMLIVFLLLTSGVSLNYAESDSEKHYNNYEITGKECGTEAHEIGGIMIINQTGKFFEPQGDGQFKKIQDVFEQACLTAELDDGSTSEVFLRDMPHAHNSGFFGPDLRICCMSTRVCGIGEPEIINEGGYLKTCVDNPDPKNLEKCGESKGFKCTGLIPANAVRKVCCTDTTPKRCPNGKRVETVCDGDDMKCNGPSYFESGHSCRKSDDVRDEHSYCCGVEAEDKCPGGYDPFAEDKEHDKISSNCDNNKFGYVFSTKKEGINYCCPRLMNQHFGWMDLEVVLEKTTDVGKEPKPCTKNSDCKEFEFCDFVEHAKLRNIKSTETFCFPDPVYIGKAVKPDGISLKNCTTDAECDVEGGEICSGSVGSHFKPLDRYAQSFKANGTRITHTCFKLEKCDTEKAVQNENLAFLMENVAVGNGFPKIKKTEHIDSEEVSYSYIEAKNHLDEAAYPGVELSCAWKNKAASKFCLAANTSLAHMTTEHKSTAVVTCAEDKDCTGVEHDPLNENPVCIKNKESEKRGVCCLASKCPSTNLEIRLENDCNEDTVCGAFGYLENRTLVGKCTEEASSKKNHCCPIIREGVPRWPYTTKIKCQNVNDCVNNPMFKGVRSLYCDNSNNETSTCAYVGLDTELKSFATKCTSNKDCENHDYKGICAVTKDGVFCHENPAKLLRGMRSSIKSKWINMCIGSFVGAIVFAIASLIFFLKYRSRHLCDRFRKNPKKDSKEDSDPAAEGSQKEKSQMKSVMSQVGPAPK